ncbi:MAG: class IV adenylate cyclase [Promethearchaeota archaeon]|nr:MAG: class IV adenylate cyclase [Candidatus Lokiarchaeota archaeon]
MIEVEIKVKIASPDELKKKFENLNGMYKLSLYHEDTYFNMPKKLRNFKKTDEALRIRKSVEFHKEYKDREKKINYFITYKGQKIDTSTKSRKELEVIIEDGLQMKEILKSLGFREIFTIKKERELYEFNYKNNKIEALIDFIPILNEYFMEVEIPTKTIEKLDDTTEILFEFLKNFEIKREESIRESYLELIAKKFSLKTRD